MGIGWEWTSEVGEKHTNFCRPIFFHSAKVLFVPLFIPIFPFENAGIFGMGVGGEETPAAVTR